MLENKQTIIAGIHMLATDKTTGICTDSRSPSHPKLLRYNEPYWQSELGTKEGYRKNFHLYATTNEKPKKGDWSIYIPSNKLHKVIEDIIGDDFKKIVATTNPELWYIEDSPAFKEIQIPKIDITFLQPYADAFNSGKPIKQVRLEQVETIALAFKDSDFKLKLKSNNSVIIHPIVEKTYTKKEMDDVLEVLNICYTSLKTYGQHIIIDEQVKKILNN